MSVYSVAIIGEVAGLAAAIQLKRYGIDALLLDAEAIGGLLRNANLVENYPGFPQGIPGIELARLFAGQLDQAGVTVTYARVSAVEDEGEAFCLHSDQALFQPASW